MQPIKPELYEPANANGPTILPFSKCTAVRTPPASRFKRISLAQSGPDFAPPTVNGMEGSFKLSNIAVRNEFRNCSVTVIVASPVGAFAARRPRVADSCASVVWQQSNTNSIREQTEVALAFMGYASFILRVISG